jgi:RNA-directed DNA polymerase
MLDALERGVKGGVWYSLIDKVIAKETLAASWKQVRRNKGSAGVDGITIPYFERHLEDRLERLHQELRSGVYKPEAIRRVEIPKAGSRETRPLGIPVIRDRIVQTALRSVIEPIFEADFAESSYGFRPKRSTKDALRRVQGLLDEGRAWVVDVDIQRYFDTISHELLMAEIGKKIADGRVLGLIEGYLKQDVLLATKSYAAIEEGTPQGAVISPLLANIYLHRVDVVMEQAGYGYVRYADDCVIVCRTREEAEGALQRIHDQMASLKLTLHPEKTKLIDVTAPGGFDFLGYHFEQGRRYPRKKSLRKLKDTVRQWTGRSNGHSLRQLIAILNPILRGWFQYFKHSRATTFKIVDGWMRRRLRSILRRHHRMRGIANGGDNLRWPNAYFRQVGLFTMVEAHRQLIRSH